MKIDQVGEVGVVLTEANEPVLHGGDQIIGYRSLKYVIFKPVALAKRTLVEQREGWVWQTRRRVLLLDMEWLDLPGGKKGKRYHEIPLEETIDVVPKRRRVLLVTEDEEHGKVVFEFRPFGAASRLLAWLTAACPWGRLQPLGLLRLSHWRGLHPGHLLHLVRLLHLFRPLLRFPSCPLPSLHPPRVEEGADEGQSQDKQTTRLGRCVPLVKDSEEEEDQNPKDDVPDDPPLREVEEPTHRHCPLQPGAKKPPVSVASVRLSQRYIARGRVGRDDCSCPPSTSTNASGTCSWRRIVRRTGRTTCRPETSIAAANTPSSWPSARFRR